MWVYQWDGFFNDPVIVTTSNSLSKLFFLFLSQKFQWKSCAASSIILLTDDVPIV
jgi:hypothetical protein